MNDHTPKRSARRVVVVWDDGSVHHFERNPGTDADAWTLEHKPPDVPEFQQRDSMPLRIGPYDRFQVTRVLVNCLDGEA